MIDMSQLAQGEYIAFFTATLFICAGIKYQKRTLGLVVAVETLLTTFLVRVSPFSYYLYDGEQYDKSWLLYNTSIIIIQCITFSYIYLKYKNSVILLAYLITIITTLISFLCASLLSLIPNSNTISAIQLVIDYFYDNILLYLSIALILAGLAKGSGGGNRSNYSVLLFDYYNKYVRNFYRKRYKKLYQKRN